MLKPGTAAAGPGVTVLPDGRVRSLVPDDLEAVALLFGRIFPARAGRRAGAARDDLGEILFRHPWTEAGLPSLAYEDRDGRLAGCLGVMARPMSLDGRPFLAAISHTFMVEPGARAGLAAVALARAFLSGGQDLSIAEGGEASRRILERLGGSSSLLYSIRWTRPLRPGRYLLTLLERRGLPRPLAWCLAPLSRAADALAPRLLRGVARPPAPTGPGEAAGDDQLLQGVAEVSRPRALRPIYDRESLAWLLDFLRGRRERGDLQRVVVRDGRGEILGFYLYYLSRGGVSEVVQVGARPRALPGVLDHLAHHAWSRGAVAVSGQLDPATAHAYAAQGSLFHHDGASWFLVHARRPEILEAIRRGDAFLTRLEGEWCISL
ncbi:MAG: hypothetical protein ACRD5D_06275 [Candidatus Polarisedimenticolia bacterium]